MTKRTLRLTAAVALTAAALLTGCSGESDKKEADKYDYQIDMSAYEKAISTKDKAYLDSILREGTEKASYIARKTIQKVYRKVGFYQSK